MPVFLGVSGCVNGQVTLPAQSHSVVVATNQPKLLDPKAETRGFAAAATGPASAGQSVTPLPPLLTARLLWRSGGGVHVPLEVGRDGTLYITSRTGYLDVLEWDGRVRFSITLDGFAAGPMYVDERGAVFIATATGLLVGFDAQGRKLFAYRPPTGVRSGLSFSTGLGLLFRGEDNVVLGVNRSGFPVYRHDSTEAIAFGPLGWVGFCVVATKTGNLMWTSRFGKRGAMPLGGGVSAMQTTASGALWVQTPSELIAISAQHHILFRYPKIVEFATFRQEQAGAIGDGVVVDDDAHAKWLDAQGQVLQSIELGSAHSMGPVRLLIPDQSKGLFWVSGEGNVHHVAEDGRVVSTHLTGEPLSARYDRARNRLVVGTREGGVYAISRRVLNQ